MHICLALLAVPPALACLYLLLTTLLSGQPRRRAVAVRRTKFDVIVPAHNEAPVIARTIQSLRQLDWPGELVRIFTVADNCTDETAGAARAAGSLILERQDESLRGKGYALDFAFNASLREGWADAIVVIDADAEVSPNLLEAFAAAIEQGASAVQAHYGVLNPNASWRTRLITIAKGSFHIVRSRARERMRVSCGIRGNGWCVTHQLLRAVPYRAYSLAEDLEYGIELGLAGYRVAYADEAHANADMVSGEKIAGKQRQRWEGGRFQLIRSKTGPLLRAAIRQRSRICLDLAVDLLVLPLSYIVLNIVLLAVSAGLAQIWLPTARPWLWVAIGCAACVCAYVLRGWRLSGIGARGILDLARAPAFLSWKLILMLRRESSEWVRTERERP